jgi:hypothetical protein
MSRLSAEIKEQIKNLSRKELEDIVLKTATKEQTILDFITINYLDKETGEKELFEKAKADLDIIFNKRYNGFIEQIKFAKLLPVAMNRVNEFTKVSKNKVLETDLILYVLAVPFSAGDSIFGTCFNGFDSKVVQIVKRLITLVTKKLQPDYLANYQDTINVYLETLHQRCGFLDIVYYLPDKI